MATYDDVKTSLSANAQNEKEIVSSVDRKIQLTNGYTALISIDTDHATVKTMLDGKYSDINKIPLKVIIDYAAVLDQVDKWQKGEVADLPK